MTDEFNINDKLNNLSGKQKAMSIICLLIILASFYYLAFTERIVLYYDHGVNVCNETYKVGKLISPMCIQNINHPDYVQPERGFGNEQWILENVSLNWT